MMDWAMMAAKELTDSYWDGSKGDHISVSQSELVASLRKAKADGMREAVEIADMAPPQKRRGILDYLKARAAEIEKGKA